MSQVLMQSCAENRDVQRYIHHYGFKLHRAFSDFLDVEDAENELWTAVFRAIHLRYVKQKPLLRFAKRAVFSWYGYMLQKYGKAAYDFHVYGQGDPDLEIGTEVGANDRMYTRVENKHTLDMIEQDLIARAKTSKQYRYAVREFRLLRSGATIKECCEYLEISSSYGNKLLYSMMRKCSNKYQD